MPMKMHLVTEEIQKLAFVIRTSVNETTGETPAFLNFGRDLKVPLDLIIGEKVQESSPDLPNNNVIQQHKSNLIDKLKKHLMLCENMRKCKGGNKKVNTINTKGETADSRDSESHGNPGNPWNLWNPVGIHGIPWKSDIRPRNN
ncbi:unnamed protein product [Rotaria socialis]|uniref:Uncharacterized protein n=1 Tax=Rotaria socialis TaxID=392032 RepID=A0A821XHZ9_9BILA|nr:unnamed protein product [Rotaria socialis]